MMKFKVMILAAGNSHHFREAGVRTHKPDLVLRRPQRGTGTMLEWCIGSLPQNEIGPVVVGAHPELERRPRVPVVWMDINNTRGQAHTLHHLLRRYSARDEPVLVINVDVLVRDICLRRLMNMVRDGADTGILVYESKSPTVPYVDKVPFATRFAEKDPISPYAMVGAWAFASSHLLARAINDSMVHMREPRLLHAMNKMWGVHECCIVERKDFTDFSTPASISEEGWVIDA